MTTNDFDLFEFDRHQLAVTSRPRHCTATRHRGCCCCCCGGGGGGGGSGGGSTTRNNSRAVTHHLRAIAT